MDMLLVSFSSEKNQSVTCMVMKEVVERKSTAQRRRDSRYLYCFVLMCMFSTTVVVACVRCFQSMYEDLSVGPKKSIAKHNGATEERNR